MKFFRLFLVGMLALSWQSVSFAQFCPADVTQLQPGYWCEVANSKVEVLDPCPGGCNYTGFYGQEGVMLVWNGGAYDTQRDRLIVWGGGHGGYGGNELYAFDVNTLAWTRVTDPSTNINNARTNTYPDGEPRSRHTYAYLEYLPNVDEFISFGGSGPWEDGGGEFTRELSSFDFNTGLWSYNRTAVPSGGSMIGALAAYDSITGYVWFTATQASDLMRYNPMTDNWAQYNQGGGIPLGMQVALDPTRHELFATGQAYGDPALFRWGLDNPAAGKENLLGLSSGNKHIENSGAPGFAYDPVTDQYVGWHDGSTIYTLNPDTLVWRAEAALGGATPTNANENGTYG
ncbi:MAG: hypothetical protein HKM24_01020, partial [Gammaproteobacteria bacterium]|nr:hypothetical protein [Gammaproteobacteria bacterium]